MNHSKHGTITGYNHYKCRCEHCRAAIAEYARKRMERNPKLKQERDAFVKAFMKQHPGYNAAVVKKHRQKMINENRCIWCSKSFGVEVFRTSNKSKYCDGCRTKRRALDKKYSGQDEK